MTAIPMRHQLPTGLSRAWPSTNLTGSSQVVSSAPTTLRGICLRETGGGSAVVRVWDSATATSSGKTMLGDYSLVAGESREESGQTKSALLGVWVEIVSGAVEGSITVGP